MVCCMARTPSTTSAWQRGLVDRVGRAVRELRADRSAQWVSDATAELGQRVGRSTIADLELGRRQYVMVHEVALLAAALGVTPATLLTYGTVPDGDLELLPGRTVPGREALTWWGGEPLARHLPAADGLPSEHRTTSELLRLTRERDRVEAALAAESAVLARNPFPGGGFDPDPRVAEGLRERLAGIERRLRELGGVVGG